MRKHSVKNEGKLKMAPMNFGKAEENRFLNGDFVSEKIKICRSVSDVSLKLPLKFVFVRLSWKIRYVVAKKMSLKIY